MWIRGLIPFPLKVGIMARPDFELVDFIATELNFYLYAERTFAVWYRDEIHNRYSQPGAEKFSLFEVISTSYEFFNVEIWFVYKYLRIIVTICLHRCTALIRRWFCLYCYMISSIYFQNKFERIYQLIFLFLVNIFCWRP